jgi:type II secretory pathway pseudopilin PulG
MYAGNAQGYSLIELVVVVGLMATATATALPRMLAGVDEARVAGAARYLAARFQDARIEAVTRSADVAIRFTATDAGYVYSVYVDGNGNGVLTRDVEHDVDHQLRAAEQLSSQFSGVDFGTLPGLPAIEAGSPAPGDDPIRFGASNMVSFSALGTSSSGTLYLRSRNNTQYAVRLVGATARVRVFRFDPRSRRWHTV